MSTRSLVTTALLLGATLAGAANLAAQSASATMEACYVTGSGTVYRVGATSTPPSCKSNHVAFQWIDGTGVLRDGDAAGGDLGGTYPAPTVVKLQGRAIAALAPADGQVLAWSAGQNRWEPRGLGGAAGATGVTAHGMGQAVSPTLAFIGTPATVNLTAESAVLVISHKALGAALVYGAHSLSLDMCYRQAGGALVSAGQPINNIQSEVGNRLPHTLSTVFTLQAGMYEVGMCGSSWDDAGSWNYNAEGKTTALIIPTG